MKQNKGRILGFVIVMCVIGLSVVLLQRIVLKPSVNGFEGAGSSPQMSASTNTTVVPVSSTATLPLAGEFVWPVDRAMERVTKKPLGIKVSPKDSPVQPEKFSGYHTGVDFEAFAEEADNDVIVRAVCTGKMVAKRSATGYGGIAIQACTVAGQPVTIIYGHLKLASIQGEVGDKVSQGAAFAVLGKGYTSETGGERKHLHLGVHVGTATTIRGYVQTAPELSEWLDIRTLVQK